MVIEEFDERKHQEELEDIMEREISHLEIVISRKANELKQHENDIERLKLEIRETRSRLEKKKIAKNVFLDEKIPKKIKPKKEKKEPLAIREVTSEEFFGTTQPEDNIKEKEVYEDGRQDNS